MKIRTIADGHDGVKTYDPGATLEGNSDHIRMLLFNNLAEPLDAEAKKFVADKDNLSDKEAKVNPHYSEAHMELSRNLENTEVPRAAKSRSKSRSKSPAKTGRKRK
jgi:hypothetical protein